jgi:predicted nuclease of predicted toxin-antitoxin system
MRFLCDVHISYKIVNYLNSCGYETIHVNTILNKWHTKDKDICKYADSNDFILISKDSDFRDSFFVKKTPKKLIKINLGNIPNTQLILIFEEIISDIKKIKSFPYFLVEIDKNTTSYFTDQIKNP